MPTEAVLAMAGKWLAGKVGSLTWGKVRRSASARWKPPVRISTVDLVKREPWTLATPTALSTDNLTAMSHITMGEVRGWLLANKEAFDHGETITRLRLTSTALEPVEIVGARAVPERRNRDRLGALILQPTAGAHRIECMGFDLASEDLYPVYVIEDGSCEWTAIPFFDRCQITLMPGEHTDINLRSRTIADTVTWRLELEVRVGNRPRVATVTYPAEHDLPFRTSDVDDCEQRWITGLGGSGKAPWLREVTIDEWTGRSGPDLPWPTNTSTQGPKA